MKSIQIQLLDNCNQRCIFCNKHKWEKKTMDESTLLKVMAKYDPETYQFSGGEPLMYPHLETLNNLLELKKATYKVYTNLSMTNLGYEQLRFLVHAKEISTSLDASTKEGYNAIRCPLNNDAFDNLIHNIQRFANKTKACMVVNNKNYKDVLGVYYLCETLGAKSRFYGVHTYDDLALSNEQIDELEEMILSMDEINPSSNLDTLISSLRDTKQKEFIPCKVKLVHRVINELGDEYTCCYGLDDNGMQEATKNIVTNISLSAYEEYDYCSRCTRYRKANEDYENTISKVGLFL